MFLETRVFSVYSVLSVAAIAFSRIKHGGVFRRHLRIFGILHTEFDPGHFILQQ